MSEPAQHGAAWAQERRADYEGRRSAQAHRGQPGERRGRPGSSAGRPVPLRLVADGGRLVPQASGQLTGPGQERVRTSARPAARQAAIRLDRAPRPARVRLTRRGRIVVTAAAVLAICAASMALAGAAQATGHSRAPAAAPGGGVTKVVIRPGQSLWSVAEAYDPNADTRLVIQDILQMNSLKSDQVQPGQVLWVPRG